MKMIKLRREVLGITQMQMADTFDVSQPTVVNWESAFLYPPAKLLPAIAEYLHCTVDELFENEKEVG